MDPIREAALELQQVADEILEEGHMNVQLLAQLRAASERFDAALSSPPPAVPPEPAELVPPNHVTDEMVTAYLTANDAYWKRTDDLPQHPAKWRNGTPREATRESLEAALAARRQT